jgi:hypothetical protein
MNTRTLTLPNIRRHWEAAERALLAPIRGAARLIGDFLAWAFRLGTTMRNGACNGIVDVIDQGSGAGSVKLYTSTQPGSVGGTYGTPLGTCPFSDPAFGNAATGVATASAITSDTSADDSGTCTTFALMDSDANVLADGTAGTSGTDMVFDNNVIVAGGTIAITAFTVTVPIS